MPKICHLWATYLGAVFGAGNERKETSTSSSSPRHVFRNGHKGNLHPTQTWSSGWLLVLDPLQYNSSILYLCIQVTAGEVDCEMVISNVKFLSSSYFVGFCVEYILICLLHQVLGGMYETKAAGGVTFQQLEWVSTILLASWLSVHIDTLKNLRSISTKFHISVLHKWNSFCGYWDLWVDIFFSIWVPHWLFWVMANVKRSYGF